MLNVVAEKIAEIVSYEGSSRSSALLRIFLAMTALYRFWFEDSGMRALYQYSQYADLWYWIFVNAAVLMLLGLFSRLSSAVTAIVIFIMYYYYGRYHGYNLWINHHIYFLAISIAMLVLTPCGRSYSLDRYLENSSLFKLDNNLSGLPEEKGNLLGLQLIVLQLVVMYFFAAIDKLEWIFIDGTRLQHIYMATYSGALLPASYSFKIILSIISIFVVLLEFVLVLLIFKRFRKWLILPGLLFHGLLFMFLPVSIYSINCMICYLAFFDADAIHRIIDKLGPRGFTEPKELTH